MSKFISAISNATQRGQASIEYVVVSAAIAGALFLPIAPGQTDTQNGQPVWQYFATKVGEAYERFSYAISLP